MKTAKKKVLLISMPFGALERQALGMSLLKAQLHAQGMACDVRYLNFSFAEFIGYDDYQWLSFELPYTAFAGDWLFTEGLYGPRPETDQAYVQQVLRDTWQLDDATISRLCSVRARVEHFLKHCLDSVPWQEYALVGFTSTFEQNLASLALARRVKEAHPDVALCFGGANWEADMGLELHRQFPFVDYACSGEAEVTFPRLVRVVLDGQAIPEVLAGIRGLTYRDGDQSVHTGPPELPRSMDDLPVPDYADYFRDLRGSTVSAFVIPHLLFETSRGCWWGAKSHCTFCGLNGGSLSYRSKSAARALHELNDLTSQWQTELVEVVDNILDMNYFQNFLPALAAQREQGGQARKLFYEVKANLNRAQVRALRDAGVQRVQPGIESLSNRVLKLMRKGTTALRNIQLLKWCQEYGIRADWNILYGFPGETNADYQDILKLLPAVRFLNPPAACGPIRLDRFSPYFENPQAFGFRNVRPIQPYRFLYPFAPESLARLAYYFDYDYAPELDPQDAARDVIAYVDAWKREAQVGTLMGVPQKAGSLLLLDSRPGATLTELHLSGPDQAVYEFCDELRSLGSVMRHLESLYPQRALEQEAVQAFMDSLVQHHLMVQEGQHYLSLALYAQPLNAQPLDAQLWPTQSPSSQPLHTLPQAGQMEVNA